MKIEHFKTISMTPALPLALRAWVELDENELCANEIMVSWDHQALVAYRPDGEPVGVITYTHSEYNYTYNIALGWVKPNMRRNNYYTFLWNELVKRAANDKAVRILSSTHWSNNAMKAVAEKTGRKITGSTITFRVPTPPLDTSST